MNGSVSMIRAFVCGSDLTHEMWKSGTTDALHRLCLPEVDERALEGLKFSEALPQRLAEATLAQRMADLEGAAAVVGESTRFVVLNG
jgi:ATP-dependent Lhr-like helicase